MAEYLNQQRFKNVMGLNKPEPVTGVISTGLNYLKQPLDYYAINKNVPLVGGMSAADFLGLTGAQGLLQDFSEGKNITGDMRMFDAMGLLPIATPAVKIAGKASKALGTEALRQMNEGSGLLGRLTVDPRHYMFVGEKGINNLGLKNVLDKANEMKSKGFSDEKIWSETAPMVENQGVRGGGITFQFGGKPQLEISDDLAIVNPMLKTDFNYAPLTSILEHPTLYKAEPSLKSVAVSPQDVDYSFYKNKEGLVGIGNPHRTTTGYNDELGNFVEQYNIQPDVIGHEINHALQFKQDLPQGGNQYTKDYLNELFNLQKEKYSPNFINIANAQPELQNLYKTSAIQDFNRILNKSSYKPSDLYRRADWYKYSDDIRSQLGTMPKKPGALRDDYIRNAYKIMFDNYRIEKGISQADIEYAISKTPAQTKYRINKIWNNLEPDYQAQREFQVLKDKNYELNQLNPLQVYDRITGEATSRLVQDRWNMTPKERGLLYPQPKTQSGKPLNKYELFDIYYD